VDGAPAQTEEVDSANRDYSADLPRLPPTPASRALDTFKVEPGFKLQLAAVEPLLADPVAMEFDEHGRLYVVEMLGYSENAADMLGRVRVLEDADRDGEFETSTVFADGFAWPTAVICYDGGVFVGAAPDILYLKDTDGDRRADERRVVFTGFGTDNVQGLLNSFRWGPDNRIHVAVSRCGADLRRADQPDAEPLVLRGRNFSFDPRTLEVEATSGASQHGFCFDAWGTPFTCHNSDHIQQVMFEDYYLSRNPLVRPPAVLKSIAVEGPAADVFRISPVEPWREIRTRLRVKGVVPGMIEGGGRAAGYFTSATGVTIYTGDAWPEEFSGNAFIGDVGSNLVHRKSLHRTSDSISYTARRATSGREFIASRDPWFRPVQFANGPDGNLYVLDMYREVIEHPASLPPIIKKHLDLTSGRDRGRIYRVVREDYTFGMHRDRMSRSMPGDATTQELVAMLAHPNGWHRSTAARLLYERNDPAASASLEGLCYSQARTAGRILAAQLLAGLDKFDPVRGLGDPDSRFTQHCVRIAGQMLRTADARGTSRGRIESIEQALIDAVDHADLQCRYELAFALGEVTNPLRIEALAVIARRDVDDEYMRAAILSSVVRDAEKLLHVLLTPPDFAKSAAGRAFVMELGRQIGARGNENELTAIAGDVVAAEAADPRLARELVIAVLGGAGSNRERVRQRLAQASSGATDRLVTSLVEKSAEIATDEAADPSARAAAVAGIAIGDSAAAAPVLIELLNPRHPQQVQLAALASLGALPDADVAPRVLEAWPGMSPTVRQRAAEFLLSRAASASALVRAVADGRLAASDLGLSTIQQLKNHADAAVREQAAKVLEDAGATRTAVVDVHRDVLDLAADASRGREAFRKHCAICHRKEDHGTEVGADLATVLTRTPEALLISILDPNREVDPKYVQYTVLTVDGVAKSGMIAAETATSVTLKRQENVTETIPRADIEELQSTGMTLMPEGFEKAIDKQSLADLIAYLRDGSGIQ
jgi:putative membrane-bound dehydrogenase-like protein